MLVLGRDIIHDLSNACARDACCTFSEIVKHPSQGRARDTVCTKI